MPVREIWPGPMEGVGRREFVWAASHLQLVKQWMTPFVRLTGTVPSAGKLFHFVDPYLNSGVPVTIQLMGTEPDLLGKCGALFLQHPAVIGINLNCGCPSSRVVRHGSGGGMLKTPEKLTGFCCKVAEYLPPGKLSVKLRSGWENSEDMEIFLPALAVSGAVSKVFFHYRTVTELYSEAVLPQRMQRISRAVELCGNIPLVANGDIRDVAEGEEVCDVSGAAGIMIARPWMRDPFLLRRFEFPEQPDPEHGRELFFSAVKRAGIGGGALIEIGKMLWGGDHPRFRQIIDEESN